MFGFTDIQIEVKVSHYKNRQFRPLCLFKGGKNFSDKYRFYNLMARIQSISIKVRCHGVFLILNFIYKLLVVRYLEMFKKSDIVMYETDILLTSSCICDLSLSL